MILQVLFTLCILVSHSSAHSVSDFCVADLTRPNGPARYPCKDPKKVTVDDFVHSGLTVKGNTTNIHKSFINTTTATQLPGLNGIGLSVARGDLEVDGVAPIHSHRVNEVLIIEEGTVIAAFIDSNNTAYYKKLNKGDIIVLPQTLLHFFFTVGSTPVVTYSIFGSEDPGIQDVDLALFGGNLPSEYIQKISFVNQEQLHKLKKLFGGTN